MTKYKDEHFLQRAEQEPTLSQQLCCRLCGSSAQHSAQPRDQRTSSFRFFSKPLLVHRPLPGPLHKQRALLASAGVASGAASSEGSSAVSCTSLMQPFAHAVLPAAEPSGRRQSSFLDYDDAHFRFSHLFSAVEDLFESWLDRLQSGTSQQQKEMRFFLPAEVDLAGTQLCSRTRYGAARSGGVARLGCGRRGVHV